VLQYRAISAHPFDLISEKSSSQTAFRKPYRSRW
jgi:hypothetical protein